MVATILFFVLLAIGVPIAATMMIVGLFYVVFSLGMDPLIAAQRVVTGADSFALLAVPFFMLAAELMNHAGITERIYRFANACAGWVSGGLGHVNILGSMLFAGMSGSAAADAAGLGKLEIKAMTDEGYDIEFAAALTAASSTIGPIIPPSISFVIYGLMAGVSIGGLFAAGIIPGILMGISLMVAVSIYAKRHHQGAAHPFNATELRLSFQHAFLALMTPIIIVGGILIGFVTPTEAGALAVLYALILGLFVYRTLKWNQLADIILETAATSANVLFIIAASALIAWILTVEGIPNLVAEWVVNFTKEPWVFLLLINLLLLVLGCFMCAAPVIIMLVPVLLPAATALGIDPIHFGVVMVLNLMIGLITPPFGLCLFIVADIAKRPVTRIAKALIPFIIPLVVVLIMVTYWPSMVLWIPKMLGYA